MRQVPTRFWGLAATLLAINAAGVLWIHHDLTATARPHMRIMSLLPTVNAETADRLSLLFDGSVVPEGTIGQRLDRAPFSMDPPHPGHWTWSGTNRLEFLLDEPLPPGRVFSLKVEPELELSTGQELIGDADFQVQTRRLELDACVLTASDHENATFELRFNQPVAPADLLRHVEVRSTREDHAFTPACLTAEPGNTLTLRVSAESPGTLEVRLFAGLTGHNAMLPLGQEIRQSIEIRQGFALLNAEARIGDLSPVAVVYLNFSRWLHSGTLPAIGKGLTIDPPVEGVLVRREYNALVLEGRFASRAAYRITVDGSVLSEDGMSLGKARTIEVTIPARGAALSFSQGEGILSPRGNLLLDLRAVNTARARLSAARVHRNNLVAHIRGSGRTATSSTVVTREVAIPNIPNEVTPLAVELEPLIGDRLGVYHLSAESLDQAWTRDETVVTVSDLGITAKRQRGGWFAWVTSLRTAEPVAGATLTAYSFNNQELFTATTNQDGTALLPVPESEGDKGLYLIAAELGDDLSYIQPESRPWVLDDVDQSGRVVPDTYDVMLYPERTAYRPGETIHLTGIVRDRDGQTPPPFPLTVTVRRPDGRMLQESTLTPRPEEQSVFHVDVPTTDEAWTGIYRAEVHLPGSKQTLGETDLLVAAYVPVRMEVNAAPGRARFAPGETPEVTVQARYLFGQPAADLAVSAKGWLAPATYTSASFAGFSFEPAANSPSEDEDADLFPVEAEATLDAAGTATLRFDPPPERPRGRWKGLVGVGVREPGGRTVTNGADLVVDTSDAFVGLRVPGGSIVSVNEPVDVEWVRVDGEDRPVGGGEMHWTLSRVDYDNSVQMLNDRYVWRTVERLTEVAAGDVPASESPASRPAVAEDDALPIGGTFTMICPQTGTYRLILRDPEAKTATKIEFNATSGGEDDVSLSMRRPERLHLTLDRERYRPGETAHLLVKSPFAGTLLLTVESDRVVYQRVVAMAERSQKLEVPVDAELRGGAFVTAAVVRPIDPATGKWLPHRALGMVRLRLDHEAARLPLSLEAPDKARPGDTVTVTCRLPSPLPGAASPVVHLWAVDEGILQLTSYETPDPMNHFFSERRSEVRTFDLFSDLLPDHQRAASIARIGAGEDKEMYDAGGSARLRPRTPQQRQPREPAVIWRQATRVDADGMLIAEIPLPKMTGRLRIMAVAIDGDRYVGVELPLTVTAPLLAEATWPRFVAPGDAFEVPVKLFNTTSEPLSVAMSLAVDGPIEVKLPDDAAAIAPGANQTVWLTAKATGSGQAIIKLKAAANGADGEALLAETDADLLVRPPAALHTERQLLRIAAGTPQLIATPDLFLPGSVRTTLRISGLPEVHLQPALRQLLDYPYGCVEQTTSRLLALLHAPALLSEPSPEVASATSAPAEDSASIAANHPANDMIAAGIARLWSMQTRSGGLSYWPGGTEPDDWGSAYAANFLVQARDAGHRVDPRFLDELSKYLESRLRDREDDTGAGDAGMRAMLCRVLAGLERPQTGWMARLSEQPDKLSLTGRADLAAAWLVAGRRDRAAELLTPEALNAAAVEPGSDDMITAVRQQAVLLNTLLSFDPAHPLMPSLVRDLEAARSGGRWGNTLESATALCALARYQRMTDGDGAAFTGRVMVDGREFASFDDRAPASVAIPVAAKEVVIESAGHGHVYATVTAQGLLAAGAPQGYDRQIVVRRAWLDRAGEPIDPAKIRSGDLVMVEATLSLQGDEPGGWIRRLAVVDALPGGMEVEHPSLDTSAPDDRPPGAQAERTEFLDDRVVLFTDVGSTPKVFRYALRAVTPGTFAVPPIEASSMYNPACASLNGGGRIVVSR